ncbi:MFS transporter [Kitasatospora sp. CB02891]|uniref:MFS transporter n=1 Tax=Kitasatospora sp. CB02891 TaxID=2020329 RepID=UPI00267C41B8
MARTGDEMSGPALLLAGFAAAGSTGEASALLAALTAASALGGPLLGVHLDRARHPGRLLARALALYAAGLLAVLAALGRLPLPAVLALAAATGLLGPALSGGWTAQLPRVAPPDRLPRANALDAMTYDTAALAGPALAGTVAATLGADAAVLLAAALIAAALPAAWTLPARDTASGRSRPGRNVAPDQDARPSRGIGPNRDEAHSDRGRARPRSDRTRPQRDTRSNHDEPLPDRNEAHSSRDDAQPSHNRTRPERGTRSSHDEPLPDRDEAHSDRGRARPSHDRIRPERGTGSNHDEPPPDHNEAHSSRDDTRPSHDRTRPQRGTRSNHDEPLPDGDDARPRPVDACPGQDSQPDRHRARPDRHAASHHDDPRSDQDPDGTRPARDYGSIRSELAAGLRLLTSRPALARATFVSVGVCAAQGILAACLPLLGERALGGASRGPLLLTCTAVAALLANAALARRPHLLAPDAAVRLGALLQAVALALAATGANGRPWVLLAAAALAGLGDGPLLTGLFAVRHREAPAHLRGQIFTTGASLKITAFALGAALAGPLATHSVPATLAAAAALTAATALVGPRAAEPASDG